MKRIYAQAGQKVYDIRERVDAAYEAHVKQDNASVLAAMRQARMNQLNWRIHKLKQVDEFLKFNWMAPESDQKDKALAVEPPAKK